MTPDKLPKGPHCTPPCICEIRTCGWRRCRVNEVFQAVGTPFYTMNMLSGVVKATGRYIVHDVDEQKWLVWREWTMPVKGDPLILVLHPLFGPEDMQSLSIDFEQFLEQGFYQPELET